MSIYLVDTMELKANCQKHYIKARNLRQKGNFDEANEHLKIAHNYKIAWFDACQKEGRKPKRKPLFEI